MPSITSIKLNLSERLREDKEFRKGFFRTQTEDRIAISIRVLRNMRKKRQVDLAKESGMLQSAISRIEQADYGNWSLKTLFRVADALDARLRIDFDPIETVIEQYREKESEINQNEFPLELSETIVTCNDVARESFLETADNQNLNDRLTHANYI
jgi:transcriptional regulator with XRE-family HTH domain